MGRIRGTSIRGTLDFVKATYGDDAPERALSALNPSTRTAIGEGGVALLPDGWYDCDALVELTRVIDNLYGSGDLGVARAAGKFIAFQDVNRFFKWLLRAAGPARLFSRASSVWTKYHGDGRLVVENVGPREATLRVEEWSSADPVMCKRIEGWIERTLELTLGSDLEQPKIQEKEHVARDPVTTPHLFCRYVATWKSKSP